MDKLPVTVLVPTVSRGMYGTGAASALKGQPAADPAGRAMPHGSSFISFRSPISLAQRDRMADQLMRPSKRIGRSPAAPGMVAS